MEIDKMKDRDIRDIIYFLSVNYKYQGYTEEMIQAIKKLSCIIYEENIKTDKELMMILREYPSFH